MKETKKKLLIYVVFVFTSILFVIGGSYGVEGLLTQRYETIISNEVSKPKTLKKCNKDRKTYQSLSKLNHPKVKLLAGDQGANDIIGVPIKIKGHNYDVSLKSESNNWNEYYVPAKLQSIGYEN